MRGVGLALLLMTLVPSAQAGDWGAVGAGYRFAGVPDFLMSGTFEDHQPVLAHSGMLDYYFRGEGGSWRAGLVVAQLAIPDGFWRIPETRVDQAVYAEFPLGMVGVTGGYTWQVDLGHGLSIAPTLGLGLLIVYGNIYATELIPGCDGAVTSCGHWNKVTRHEVSLTSRWMPLFQLSAALQWEFAAGSQVGIEAGVINLPFTGITFQQSLDL